MKLIKSIIFLLFINFQVYAQSVIDFDGNVYNTVTIGSQVWIKENLKATHYSDGTLISNIYAYDDDTANVAIYGWLYGIDAAMKNETTQGTQGACPVGWHLPSKNDWDTLVNFLGGKDSAGKSLKEIGSTHWSSNNISATNNSNFTALGAGQKSPLGFSNNYISLKSHTFFWSSTLNDSILGRISVGLRDINDEVVYYNTGFPFLSVRCVSNTLASLNNDLKKSELNIFMYPNPCNDKLTITGINKKTTVELYDNWGKLIVKEQVDNNFNLDVSSFHAGTYMLLIKNNKEISYRKVFILR